LVWLVPVHNLQWKDNQGDLNPGGLLQNGPVLAVLIAVPPALAAQLQKANQAIPTPVGGFALFDTGATFSAIDNGVVQQLNLQPVGVANVGGTAGVNQHSLFAASLSFPGSALPSILHSRTVGVDLAGHVIKDAGGPLVALIGRDILSQFVMVYNGVTGTVTFAH